MRLSILSGGQDGPDSVESVYDEAEEAVLAVDPRASVLWIQDVYPGPPR